MIVLQENQLSVPSDLEDLKSSPFEETLNQIFKRGKNSKEIEKLKADTKRLIA